MHAATHPAPTPHSPCVVAPPTLPCSNAAVKPDRGDWEFLMAAVGRMRVRPISAPPAGSGGAEYDAASAPAIGTEPTNAPPGT